jgi:hypothetical protein
VVERQEQHHLLSRRSGWSAASAYEARNRTLETLAIGAIPGLFLISFPDRGLNVS